MKKIFNIIFVIFFLGTTGCWFTPILVKSNYSFSYIIEKSTGSERVNSNIEEKLKALNDNEKKYNLVLNSKETKNIL